MDWLMGDEARRLAPLVSVDIAALFVQTSPNGDVLLDGLSLPAAPEQNLVSTSTILYE